jgi:protein required for attachment to host cells
MKIVTWIVVADGARAHVLKNEGIGKGLEPVTDLVSATQHRPARELGTDKPGRTFESASAARHAMEPRVDWHRFEKHRFAGDMAAMLNQQARDKAFERLVLVAPPEILGVLRAELDDATRKLITGELAKDLTHEPIHGLPERLREVVNL